MIILVTNLLLVYCQSLRHFRLNGSKQEIQCMREQLFYLKVKSYLQTIWAKPTDFPSRGYKPPLSVSFIRDEQAWTHSSVQGHTWFTEQSYVVGDLVISI